MFRKHDELGSAAQQAALHPLDIVDTRGAAKILGLSESLLHKMRASQPNTSPSWIQCGPRRVFYRIGDLLEWQNARIVGGTHSLPR